MIGVFLVIELMMNRFIFIGGVINLILIMISIRILNYRLKLFGVMLKLRIDMIG